MFYLFVCRDCLCVCVSGLSAVYVRESCFCVSWRVLNWFSCFKKSVFCVFKNVFVVCAPSLSCMALLVLLVPLRFYLSVFVLLSACF